MDRVYRATTLAVALDRMRAEAASLGADYRIGWTSRDTVCPTPTGVLCLAAAVALAGVAVAAWPPALVLSGLVLLLGILRIRECTVTVTYVPNDGPNGRARAPGG